jgi:hypothetical protein
MAIRRFGIAAIAALMYVGAVIAPVHAQQGGATLTVQQGTVAVVHADGTADGAAPSGSLLRAGDRVATVGKSSAIITFFEGSEVELGPETTIVIQEASGGPNSLVNITVENVLGTTVHRVITLTNPESNYKIEAGGSVALIRGTVIGIRTDENGNVTVALESVGELPARNP